ncbi:hypothetical protein SALBM135S_02734 [Streptomyces alboniger]
MAQPVLLGPGRHAGDDVADYRAIDPMFGDLHDADALLRDAHSLGLRVIVDLVPNHSSDRHDWFQRALREGPGSPLRERYHFRPGKGADGELPPNDWESIFGGPAWHEVEDGELGTLTCSSSEQPDFNWDHPADATSSVPSCGSGSTWAWTASASTSPTAWSRRRACRTSARTTS